MIKNLHCIFMLFCCIAITNKTIAQSNSTLSTVSMPYFQTDSLRCTGQDLQFTNIATGQAHAVYQWTFVGATTTTSSDSIPVGIHYQQEGDYDVCLVVRDSNSIVWSVPYCKTVHIGNPHISFTSDTSGTFVLHEFVTFTSTSTNCASYKWHVLDADGQLVMASMMNPCTILLALLLL